MPVSKYHRLRVLPAVLALSCATVTCLAQNVIASADQAARAVWVGAGDYNIRNSKDYGSIVMAASLNAFFKTYPNATQAQAEDVVNAIQTRLSGLPKTDYVFGHQTQEDLVNAAFSIVGDTSLPPAAKVSLTVGRQAYDLLRREYNGLLDEQAKVAAETTLDIGFRMSADTAFVQKQLEQLYDNAKSSPVRAAVIDGKLGTKLGSPTSAPVDSILKANPAFAQFKEVLYLKAHMLTNGQFQDGLSSMRGEFSTMLNELKSKVNDDVLPLLQSMNKTQLLTYATLQDYIAATAEKERQQQVAEQKRQAHELQLQATQSGVYLLSTFAGLVDPKLGRTLNVVGTTAIQVNQALTNFSVAASSVDTSLIGGKFTGAQLGSVVLAGNLVGAAMQIAGLFQDNPSPDQIILEQIAQLRQQLAQMQSIMIDRFDRVDAQLGQIAGSLDSALKQLSIIGADLVQVQTQIFGLQSQVSRLELEIHDWLRNTDRIPLLTAINTALGYEKRNGRKMSIAEFLNYEGLFFTWATVVVKDTTRAGPDYATDIVMANQLKFPLASNINYLAQLVSKFLGFPQVAQTGARLPNLNDYLFSASAYYRLIIENPDYVGQLPGAMTRLKDVASVGKQLKVTMDAMANKDLFLDAAKGLVPLYKKRRDALKTAVAAYRDNTFIPANTCGSSSFDGCIPPGVDLMWETGGNSSHRPSIAKINGCDGQHNYNYNIPGNDIYYAVRSALLDSDRRAAGQIGICLAPSWVDSCASNGAHMKLTVVITYRGIEVLSMSVVPNASFGCKFTPDPWFFLGSGQFNEWDSAGPSYTYRRLFEDHSQVTVTTAPWAQKLYETLTAKRAQYYASVAQELTKDSPIGRAATDLNVAKNLLMSFLELGMPRTLQGNDLLRSLLYGDQQLYAGFDQSTGIDVKSLYARAGSVAPEINIEPSISKRLDAVSSVIAQVFTQISVGQFRETNLKLETMIRKLDDYVSVAESAPPTCSYSVFPTTLTIGASGGPLSLSIATDSACAWSIGGLQAWATASPASGKGPATVTLTVQANQSDARSASFLAADKTITLSQDAKAQTCTFTITPSGQTFPAAGGSVAIDITASAPSCLWSISALPSWVTASSASGSGSARVTLQTTANPGTARSVTATVASRPFLIDQAAATTGASAGLLVRDASAGPGKTFELAIGLSGAANKPVAVQFDIVTDPSALAYGSIRKGEQALAAGKDITVSATSGRVRVVVAGVNQNVIGDGPFAYTAFTLSRTMPLNSQTPVSIANVQFVNAQGQAVPATGSTAVITAAGCIYDLNGDGLATVSDIQILINQILGVSADRIDLNNDGRTDVIDLQLLINAVLTSACVAN